MDDKLHGYEKELGLIAKRRSIEACLTKLRSAVNEEEIDRAGIMAIADRIEEVI